MYRVSCILTRSSYEPLQLGANAFHYVSHRLAPMRKDYNWTAGARGSPPDAQWPPLGLHLVVVFKATASASEQLLKGVTVEVHHEMYQGLPAASKWVTVSSDRSSRESPAEVRAGRGARGRVAPDQRGRVNLQLCDQPLPSSAGAGASMVWRADDAGRIALAPAPGQPAGGICLTARPAEMPKCLGLGRRALFLKHAVGTHGTTPSLR